MMFLLERQDNLTEYEIKPFEIMKISHPIYFNRNSNTFENDCPTTF